MQFQGYFSFLAYSFCVCVCVCKCVSVCARQARSLVKGVGIRVQIKCHVMPSDQPCKNTFHVPSSLLCGKLDSAFSMPNEILFLFPSLSLSLSLSHLSLSLSLYLSFILYSSFSLSLSCTLFFSALFAFSFYPFLTIYPLSITPFVSTKFYIPKFWSTEFIPLIRHWPLNSSESFEKEELPTSFRRIEAIWLILWGRLEIGTLPRRRSARI